MYICLLSVLFKYVCLNKSPYSLYMYIYIIIYILSFQFPLLWNTIQSRYWLNILLRKFRIYLKWIIGYQVAQKHMYYFIILSELLIVKNITIKQTGFYSFFFSQEDTWHLKTFKQNIKDLFLKYVNSLETVQWCDIVHSFVYHWLSIRPICNGKTFF